MQSSFTVVYDACVLYPASVRDLLMEIAYAGLYRARWTNQIHDEWIRNLLENRPDLTLAQLHYTRDRMNAAIPDCLVQNYEALIPALSLPDPDDRHILAAAIAAKASVIVTFNTKDFPETALEPHGIEAQHPDDFLVYQFDLAPETIRQSIQRLRARLLRPPMSTPQYLKKLQAQQLIQFAQKLRTLQHLL